MKKISVILIAICTFLLIGCSSNNKKSDLKEKDVNAKTVYNNQDSQSNNSNDKALSEKSNDNEKTDEKVKEKSEDNKDKKKASINIDNGVKSNTKTKNGNKIATTTSNKKSKISKVQKNNVNQIIINEMNLEKNSPFKMGMSIDTVRSILKKNNIEIESETEITSSFDDPEWGDKVLDIKNMYLQFDKKNNKLHLIGVSGNYKTSLGLANGDSIDKMKKLYGTKYKVQNISNIITYTYKINNHYFSVHDPHNSGKVTSWSIKKLNI